MFKDHFSHNSKNYAKYRPGYPSGLFDFIISNCRETKYVWDVGCGNGQASSALAEHFDKVLATDASAEQINAGQQKLNINYLTAPAEACPESNDVFDLVTAAQAIHWFDLEKFFEEVKRVVKPGGYLAFWTYDLPRVNLVVDTVVNEFYAHTVGDYWPPERNVVDSKYATINAPFRELECPVFEYSQMWSRDDVFNYISTWSAVKNYRNIRGEDPMEQFLVGISKAWPIPEQKKLVTWNNYLRMFKLR